MRKTLLVVAFLLLSVFLKAQTYSPYVYCVDSTIIDIYYHCNDPDYNPVCACNGVTYRNSCAADHWGGLATSHNYQSGVCGNFDFDIVPNVIIPGSQDYDAGRLSVYTNAGPVAVFIQIIDVYGRQWYLQEITINISPPAYTTDIHMDGFPIGVYYLFVTVNGESHTKKMLRANLQ